MYIYIYFMGEIKTVNYDSDHILFLKSQLVIYYTCVRLLIINNMCVCLKKMLFLA
jgi:hypothetical protein